MSAVVSRRSLLGWLAALPLAAAVPKLAPAIAPAVAKVETTVTAALEDFGIWSNYAMWHLVRAYNLTWKVDLQKSALAEHLPGNGVELDYATSVHP